MVSWLEMCRRLDIVGPNRATAQVLHGEKSAISASNMAPFWMDDERTPPFTETVEVRQCVGAAHHAVENSFTDIG